MTYSIYHIIFSRLITNKHRLRSNLLFDKTLKLLDIWDTQKRLIILTNSFDDPDYVDRSLVSESYVTLIMENNLIFLEEVSDPTIMLNLLYYWLLTEIKRNRLEINKM